MDADVPLTNGTEADGEVVWSWRPDAGVKLVERSASDGGKQAGHRGEREVSRKTIAQGRPDASAEPVCSCAFLRTILHTRPRVQRASGIPRSLFFRGTAFVQNFGRLAPRDREDTYIRIRLLEI